MYDDRATIALTETLKAKKQHIFKHILIDFLIKYLFLMGEKWVSAQRTQCLS